MKETTVGTLEAALDAARSNRPAAVAELAELLAIPSVSADPGHDADVQAAARWVAERLERLGMQVEVNADYGKPVIAAEWLGRPGAPTLAIYGHYDVQPPDPLEEWVTPPFEPTEREGNIYARGATDDKGQFFAALKAVEYAFGVGPPPLNLRFLIEGEEEIGGRALPEFLLARRDRLATDYVFIADAALEAPGQPKLITGLRGLLYVEIDVRGPAVDLHSGVFGGVAPNPFNSLAHILAGLKGRDGKVNIPGFYSAVRPPAPEELQDWDRLPTDENTYLRQIGARALEGEAGYSVHERVGSRPTMDVHGVIGGFIGEGQKTVIPARARAKVSFRLVPDQQPGAILAALRQRVEELATPGVQVEVRELSSGRPMLFGSDHPGMEAARRAFAAAFGAEPVFVREGGSIPVTTELDEALQAPLVVTGFGLPSDGVHSPNEHMSLDNFHRATEMVLHLLHELAPGAS